MSAAVPAASLPAQPSPFVDRERELNSLRHLLLRERLVTLVGPGGAGKTRLALKLAENLQRQFADAVSLVELSPLTAPQMLARVVAQAHGIIEDGQTDAVAQLVAHFSPRQALLVLDNCEHVVEETATLVQSLLQKCPRLTVMATSRERLGVAGETLWRVQPMEVPAPGREYRPEDLARIGAVALFVDRATRSSPGFEVDSSNAGVISELVRRLDGLPLAVELAAAWTGVLSSEDLLANLSDRFQLLTTKQRSVPSRHRSLRAAIDSSYENLEMRERWLSRRLGLFAGGWNLESMNAVCGLDEAEGLQLLRTLVDRSLVTAQTLEAGPTRYRMLASLSEYAREKLRDAGEAADARKAFCKYFLHLAETANEKIYRPVGATWLARLDTDRDNLTVALEIGLEDDPVIALRLAAALASYWDLRGLYAEGRLRLSRAVDAGQPPSQALASARRGLATMAWAQGDQGFATRQARRALGVSDRLGDPDGQARALQLLAQIRFATGDLATSRARLERALPIASELPDHDALGLCLFRLGGIAMAERRWADAETLLDRSIQLGRDADDAERVAMGSMVLGRVQLETGRSEEAESTLRESLSIWRRHGSPRQIARILETMAALASDRGHLERAARLAGASAGLLDRAGVNVSPPADADLEVRIQRSLERPGASRSFEGGKSADLDSAIRFALGEAVEAAPQGATRAKDAATAAGLTPRQVTVARLVAQGYKNKEIAARLFISERTAEGHVEQVRNKLGLGTRSQIAAWVTQNLGSAGTVEE